MTYVTFGNIKTFGSPFWFTLNITRTVLMWDRIGLTLLRLCLKLSSTVSMAQGSRERFRVTAYCTAGTFGVSYIMGYFSKASAENIWQTGIM